MERDLRQTLAELSAEARRRLEENLWAMLQRQGTFPQHAVRQGVHLARNRQRIAAGKEGVPFEFDSVGSLAALGCRTGVAKIFGLKLSGFWAWFLWRTVYLLKMPGLARKARLALDWTLDMIFGRDIVQLGVHRTASGRNGLPPPPRAGGGIEPADRDSERERAGVGG